jgi:hypothetical protein
MEVRGTVEEAAEAGMGDMRVSSFEEEPGVSCVDDLIALLYQMRLLRLEFSLQVESGVSISAPEPCGSLQGGSPLSSLDHGRFQIMNIPMKEGNVSRQLCNHVTNMYFYYLLVCCVCLVDENSANKAYSGPITDYGSTMVHWMRNRQPRFKGGYQGEMERPSPSYITDVSSKQAKLVSYTDGIRCFHH